MSDSITIHLAGQSYVIHPFTVEQLQELHIGVVLLESPDPKENVRNLWRRNTEIIAAALSEDYKHITLETVRKMRLGTVNAMNAAVDQILVFSGIIREKKEVSPQGEAQAAA